MRQKNGKRFAAAAVSGLLAAAVLITAVLSGKMEVEAAETFLGIEELRNEVAESQRTYTILEIVPDRNAAEIGFLFDGYEPVLSTWNEEEQRWDGWRETLCSLETFDERKTYIEGLKQKLLSYYEAKGINGDKPVSAAKGEYEESDKKEAGFEVITAAATEKTGWFVPRTAEGGDAYQVKFKYLGAKSVYDEESEWVYYKISGEPVALCSLSEEELLKLADDTVIYSKESGEGVYSVKCLWSEMKEDTPVTEETEETETKKEKETESQSEPETTGETEKETKEETKEETGTTVETETETTGETEKESTVETETESIVPESSEEGSSTQESSDESAVPDDEAESVATENVAVINTADFATLSSTVTDVTDTQKETEEVQTVEEKKEPETGKEQETESTKEEEASKQPETEEEQTQGETKAEVQNVLGADGAKESAENDYYLVSFVKATDIETLNDKDTLYIVEDGGIIKSDNGEYCFVESTEESERKQTYPFGGITLYCKNTFTNNEWFKKNALDMEEADYKKFQIQVLTFTPAELNAMNELPKFDFLYLNSGARVINSEAEKVSYNKETMDLSEEVVKKLFIKISESGIPCLVDGAIMYEKDAESDTISTIDVMKETQIFRLMALLCQKSLDDWKQYSENLSALPIVNLLANIIDSDRNFSTEQTYCRFDANSIINSEFAKATIHKGNGEVKEGFQSVLAEINVENLYRESDKGGKYEKLSTDISEARVLRHIINYKNRRTTETKKHVKVLEIQPALTSEENAEITLERLKQWAPDVETMDRTIMTTAEFIGKIEKLNETYDLIYIGTSKEHLNMKNWTGGDVKNSAGQYIGSTVFNDSDMDGLIYYNIGDLRVTNMALAGLLDTEYWEGNPSDYPYYYNYTRYGGNDITSEKKEALISFLDGSYPIIVSDDFIEQPVTVYQDAEYKGCRVNLTEKDYTKEQLEALGVKTGDISSIKVKEGYEVILYSEDEYGGDTLTVSKDIDLKKENNSWNEKVISLKVKKKEDSTPVRATDEDHIDNCTYLYEFVQQALEGQYNNFFVEADLQATTSKEGSELFKFYLNRPKASVVDTTVNGEKKDNIYYIDSDAYGKYHLQYSFTIKNEGAATYDTRYKCKLYIDVNSDGKFSAQEEVTDISVYQEDQSQVSAEELYADRKYTVKRQVPDGYKGLLPWKIEITQCNNDNIYTSMNGYTKLKVKEPEVLNIVQIGRDQITEYPYLFGGTGEELFNLGTEINDQTKNSIFYKLVHGGNIEGVTYEGIDNEFEINVTFLTISQFEAIMKDSKNKDYLKDYNMLILGFSDMYGDITETKAINAIVEFIDSGKSVLFAHDTTSYFNYPAKTGNPAKSYAYPWRDNPNHLESTDFEDIQFYYNAAGINEYVRPLVGMDRYGVQSSEILKKGKALSADEETDKENFDNVVSSGKDVAYKPKSGKTQTVPEVHGYTYITINGKDRKARTDVYSTDNSFNRYELDMSKPEPDKWSFTNTYTNIRYDTVYYKYSDKVRTDQDNGEIIFPYNAEVDDLYVTQVNEGQITEYPYKLPEKFRVAETHGQSYQLDYNVDDDKDGESDLVVWFCLSTKGTGADEKQTVYSQSPNDVRNNYYIYNKGNVTYTGMGHSAHREEQYTVDEAKLFINTIIASYQAGIKPPSISVKQSALIESPEIHTMYRYYDEENHINLNSTAAGEKTVGDCEKIYFTVQDVNFVKGTRNIMSHFYYDDGTTKEAQITVNGNPIDVGVLNANNDSVYDAASGAWVDANNLQSGGIYYILVPKSVLAYCETGLDLYFEAQSTITSYTNVYTTDKVYAKLEVLKAQLFDLD